MNTVILNTLEMHDKQKFIEHMNQIIKREDITNLDGLYDALSEVNEEITFVISDAMLYDIASNEMSRKCFELILNAIHENPYLRIVQE